MRCGWRPVTTLGVGSSGILHRAAPSVLNLILSFSLSLSPFDHDSSQLWWTAWPIGRGSPRPHRPHLAARREPPSLHRRTSPLGPFPSSLPRHPFLALDGRRRFRLQTLAQGGSEARLCLTTTRMCSQGRRLWQDRRCSTFHSSYSSRLRHCSISLRRPLSRRECLCGLIFIAVVQTQC